MFTTGSLIFVLGTSAVNILFFLLFWFLKDFCPVLPKVFSGDKGRSTSASFTTHLFSSVDSFFRIGCLIKLGSFTSTGCLIKLDSFVSRGCLEMSDSFVFDGCLDYSGSFHLYGCLCPFDSLGILGFLSSSAFPL